MPPVNVDFYLLANDNAQARYMLACRLLEKAFVRGHQVFVYCNDRAQAEHIDELLWTFKEDSFIPHNLQGEGPQAPPPIQIGHHQEPRGFNDILLNLAEEIPPFFARFRRIIEIVSSDEAAKEQSRLHYRHYRAQGCELRTHELAEVG